VTTATRSEALPDIPTVGEFVPGYEASGWSGIGSLKNPPSQIIDKLNKEINAGLADPNMKARLADLCGTVLVGSPADFGKLITDDIEKWGNDQGGLRPIRCRYSTGNRGCRPADESLSERSGHTARSGRGSLA
jgi:Tripartite tricarboxylate transporter family receptor